MAYVAFDKLPLNFGTDKDQTSITNATDGNTRSVDATNVSISYNANLATTRVLGADANRENVHIGGPPSLSLSFNGILSSYHTEFDPFDYTGDTANGTCVMLGPHDTGNGVFIKKLYMTNFSIQVAPYAPITYSCDFVGFDHFGGKSATSLGAIAANDVSTNLPSVDHDNTFHGAYSTLTASTLTDGNMSVFDSITYNYNQSFQPVYALGSVEPTSIEFMTAEQSIAFTADQINTFIPISGSRTSVTLGLKNPTDSNNRDVTVNGQLNTNGISVSVGDVARGSLSIIEPLK